MRPVRWSQQAGVVEVGGLEGRGETALPIHTAAANAGWVDGVGEQVPKSDDATGQVALVPHHVGARTIIRRSLLKQSAIDVEDWVRRTLLESLDDAIDRAILQGSGADNQPLGIVGVPGVHSVALTTAGSPTRDEVIDVFAAAAKANANPAMLTFIGDSTLAQAMRKARVEAGNAAVANKGHSGSFLLEDGQLAKTGAFFETTTAPRRC